MDNLDLKVMRGEQAQQLMKNPLFEQAFADTRTGIMEAWAGLSTSDEKRSEYSADLHKMLKCLDRVKTALSEHITTGKIASREIEGKKNLFGRRR